MSDPDEGEDQDDQSDQSEEEEPSSPTGAARAGYRIRPLFNPDSLAMFLERWGPRPVSACEAAWRVPSIRSFLLRYTKKGRVGEVRRKVKMGEEEGEGKKKGRKKGKVTAIFEVRRELIQGREVVVIRDKERGTIFGGGEVKR